MARRRTGPSKMQLVRDDLASRVCSSPKEIADKITRSMASKG